MTEETLFAALLEKRTSAERTAFLAEACAEDAPLRQRLEALLAAHENGDFLRTPAVQRAELPDIAAASAESPDDPNETSLDFLPASEKPGSLGRLGHYEVQEVVGKGGMGLVLKAFDEKLHRVAALKVMAPDLATSGIARRRFVREAQAAAAIRNDHVIDIYAVEENHEPPYLVMEYIEGQSLQELIDTKGPLKLIEILRIAMQTATGLAAAHAQGLIHRDIKPANILLENGVQRVKITDFGVARAVGDARQTLSDVVTGTPQYMSPEQARGEAVDHRADLFSFGCMLYAMCTGEPPYCASGTLAILRRIHEGVYRPICERNPEIPEWLVVMIDKLLAKDPRSRGPSAAELATLLGQRLADLHQPEQPVQQPDQPEPGSIPQPPGLQRPRRSGVVVAMVAVALGIVLTELTGTTSMVTTLFGSLSGGDRIETSGIKPDPPAVSPKDKTLASTGSDQPEAAPFVILGQDGQATRQFATLAEAVAAAADGAILEIRGNGPFVTDPIEVRDRALSIRAAKGFWPVLTLSDTGVKDDRSIVNSNRPLTLEGLELQRIGKGVATKALVHSNGGTFRLAHCRFVVRLNNAVCIWASGSPHCDVRNCEFLGTPRCALEWSPPADGNCRVENAVVTAEHGLNVHIVQRPGDTRVDLARTTLIGKSPLQVFVHDVPDPKLHHVRIETAHNVFDADKCIVSAAPKGTLLKEKQASPEEFRSCVGPLLGWHEQLNFYPAKTAWLGITVPGKGIEVLPLADRADEWRQLLGPGAGQGQVWGQVSYAGGNLRAKAATAPETLTPRDFRLRPDCPGYRAGPGERDLGADVDLVGPGPAYERWQAAPEYQAWLKNTGPVKK